MVLPAAGRRTDFTDDTDELGVHPTEHNELNDAINKIVVHVSTLELIPGPEGPPGPPGDGLSTALVFSQQVPSSVWTIAHTFPYRPDVDVYDHNGDLVYVDVDFPSSGIVTISWAVPSTGTARLT